MIRDELMVGHTRANLHIWPAGERKVDPAGELHETVIDPSRCPPSETSLVSARIDPRALSEHPKAKGYYENVTNQQATISPAHS
jgi:hypothetical protein